MTPTVATAGSAVRAALGRWQFWILLMILTAAAAVSVQLLAAEEEQPYGLSSTDLDGYAGLAAVLDDQGFDIRTASSAEGTRELLDEHPEATLVVMVRGFQPQPEFVTELRQRHQQGGEVLWVGEDAAALAGVLTEDIQPGPRIPTGTAGTPAELIPGETCRVEAAVAAETLRTPGGSLQADTGCFEVEGAEGDTSLVLADTSYGLAFAAPEAWTNQHITEAGNAALALGLLGAAPGSSDQEIIWYTPSAADTAAADQWESPLDYLPPWFWPLAAWLLLCGVLAMAVAARREGPVVAEPLPVSVPASESAYGRGRLYQRVNAIDAAARTLRSAHMVRMGRMLRLGPTPSADVIAAAAAREADWSPHRVRELLHSPIVRGNRQLTSYAQELARLENDLRDRIRMRRRPPVE